MQCRVTKRTSAAPITHISAAFETCQAAEPAIPIHAPARRLHAERIGDAGMLTLEHRAEKVVSAMMMPKSANRSGRPTHRRTRCSMLMFVSSPLLQCASVCGASAVPTWESRDGFRLENVC